MKRKTLAPRMTITLMVFRPTISRMGARETGKRKCLPLTAAMSAVAIITSTKLRCEGGEWGVRGAADGRGMTTERAGAAALPEEGGGQLAKEALPGATGQPLPQNIGGLGCASYCDGYATAEHAGGGLGGVVGADERHSIPPSEERAGEVRRSSNKRVFFNHRKPRTWSPARSPRCTYWRRSAARK